MKKTFKRIFLATALISTFSAISSFAGTFVHTPQGVKYDWGNGNYCVNNWVRTNDHWYYFGNDELMRTGWIQRDNTWYFASDTGELNAGAMEINGNLYYFDKNDCSLVTGPVEYMFNTYTFTDNGIIGDDPYVYTEWNSDGTIKRGKKLHAN
ncbi:MAG: hypothetical protein Q4B86_00650 [Eubacteriales bacterium]|nr:hypothetical protein [Eubacteriales bacterium]